MKRMDRGAYMRLFVVFLCTCVVQFFIWTTESQATLLKIKPKYIRSIYVNVSGQGFNNVTDIFVDRKNDEIFLLDYTLRRVVIISTEGTFLFDFSYKDAGLSMPPHAIAVADDGNIYMAEGSRMVVTKYNGKFLKELDLSSIQGKFYFESLEIEGDKLYIGDAASNRVIVMNRKTQKVVREYKKGFGKNMNIVMSEDVIYSLDLSTFGVYMVDRKTGKPLGRFGKVSSLTGGFSMPVDIAIDRKNKRIIVTDVNRVAVVIFDYDGNVVGEFGGDRMFTSLRSLAVGDDGRIYISDGTKAIRVFEAIDVQAYEDEEIEEVEPYDPTDLSDDLGFGERFVDLNEGAPEVY